MQNDVDIAYFEIQLLAYEPWTKLSVGLVTDAFVLDDLPGSQPRSFGYHATGEFWMHGRRKGPELPSCKAKSVIGCGLNYVTRQLFFTLDGEVIKTENDVSGRWYPCVGLHAPGQRVRANFGRNRFRYDIISQRKALLSQSAAQIDENPDVSFTRVIYNYLLFNAYHDTAVALASAKSADLNPLTERDTLMLSTLELRSQIRSFLSSGRLEDARHLLVAHFGDVAVTSEAMFALDCQTFIEHIRNKRSLEALEFSQVSFLHWWGEATYARIEECCSLLAYFEPEKAPTAYLLAPQQREQCFELVNRSILDWTGVFQASSSGSSSAAPSSSDTRLPTMLVEDEPDIHYLFAHLAKIHTAIRYHRRAGVPFSLDIYSSKMEQASSNNTMNPLRASSASTSKTRPAKKPS